MQILIFNPGHHMRQIDNASFDYVGDPSRSEEAAYLILRSHRKRRGMVMTSASATEPTTAGTTTTGRSPSTLAFAELAVETPAKRVK